MHFVNLLFRVYISIDGRFVNLSTRVQADLASVQGGRGS